MTPLILTVGQTTHPLCWDGAKLVKVHCCCCDVATKGSGQTRHAVRAGLTFWTGSCVECFYCEASKCAVWGSPFVFYLESYHNEHYEESQQVAAGLQEKTNT